MGIKYKQAESEGWFYFIDELGNKGQSWNKNNRPAMYEEMQAWVKDGNEIEPQLTSGELTAKELKDNEQDLESQNKILITLLNDSEKHVSQDPPYPDDVSTWVAARKQWRKILKSGILQEIPEKPFI